MNKALFMTGCIITYAIADWLTNKDMVVALVHLKLWMLILLLLCKICMKGDKLVYFKKIYTFCTSKHFPIPISIDFTKISSQD